MLKFLRKPSDSWLIPISIISSIAFAIQIIQITLTNVLIANNNLVFLNYFLPIMLFLIILCLMFLDNFKIKFLIMPSKLNFFLLKRFLYSFLIILLIMAVLLFIGDFVEQLRKSSEMKFIKDYISISAT